MQPKPEPDPNDQSVVLPRAIPITLNKTVLPDESPTVPPFNEDPPGELVIALRLIYASLRIDD